MTPAINRSGTVADYSDEDLLRRAVTNCRSSDLRKGQPHTRWAAVMDALGLGSTYAQQLCIRFNLDPHEMVKR